MQRVVLSYGNGTGSGPDRVKQLSKKPTPSFLEEIDLYLHEYDREFHWVRISPPDLQCFTNSSGASGYQAILFPVYHRPAHEDRVQLILILTVSG